jgi:hypothetical protein
LLVVFLCIFTLLSSSAEEADDISQADSYTHNKKHRQASSNARETELLLLLLLLLPLTNTQKAGKHIYSYALTHTTQIRGKRSRARGRCRRQEGCTRRSQGQNLPENRQGHSPSAS